MKCTIKNIVASAALLMLANVSSSAPRSVHIHGAALTDDATLSAWNDTSNFGAMPSYELRNYQANSASWPVVRFKLPSLSPGEYIGNADISFDYFANYDTTPGSMVVHLNRILKPWNEASVSWRYRTSTATWGGPYAGAENIDSTYSNSDNPINYATTSLGSVVLEVGVFGLKAFESIELTSILNDMQVGALPNYGFLLNPSRSGGVNNRFYFVSSERGTAFLPELSISVYKQKSFPLGWYHFSGSGSKLKKMASEGSNTVIIYATSDNNLTQQYLDAAQSVGINVVVQLNKQFIENIHEVINQNRILATIDAFEEHDALLGWYLADEPETHGISINAAEQAYGLIKPRTSKPIFMAFSEKGMDGNTAELEGTSAIVAYAESYDVALFDIYPFYDGSAEFYGFEVSDTGGKGWKAFVQQIANESSQLGKKWWVIPQGYGKQPEQPNYTNRLPTKNEIRFQAYWSILNGAEGVVSWSHYRMEDSLATTGDLYKKSGLDWLNDIWRPLANEFALHGDAVKAGPTGLVSDNRTSVLSDLYLDPITGEYYLVAVNGSSFGTYPTFTIDVPGLQKASYLGEIGNNINIVNGKFADSFPAYSTHVYKLVP